MPSSSHPVIQQLRAITSSHNVPTPFEINKIINQAKLKYLGSGSSRVVWSLGDGTVVKVALGPDETSQNKSEVEAFKCAGPEYLAEVFDHDSDQFWWLVMEEVITGEAQLNGIIKKWFLPGSSLDDIESLIWFLRRKDKTPVVHAAVKRNKKLTPEEQEKIIGWLVGFQRDVISKCDISMKDIRTPNVGVRSSTGLPVVIDYANFDLLKWESVVPSLAGLLFESRSENPLLTKVKAAKTRKQLFALTKTPLFKTELVGEGSTRMVYDLGDAVLKIEKLHSDSQNKSEVEVFKCSGPKFFAEILDYDKQNLWWLVMEKIDADRSASERKLTTYFGPESRFRFIERLTEALSKEGGLDDVLLAIEANQWITPQKEKEAREWVTHFASIIKSCDVDVVDFHEGNVGIRPSTNQLVFHDYANYSLVGAATSSDVPLSEVIFPL